MSETPTPYRVGNVLHVDFCQPHNIEFGDTGRELLLNGRVFLEIYQRMRGKPDRKNKAAAAARKIHRMDRDADVLRAYGVIHQ